MRWRGPVSILVLMDFRLKDHYGDIRRLGRLGFNPCSNGLSAQRQNEVYIKVNGTVVSILVLMDFRLKETGVCIPLPWTTCFNPCSNGLSAQRYGKHPATPAIFPQVSILVLMDFRLKGGHPFALMLRCDWFQSLF